MGKFMHWEWEMTSKVENSHQNKVCQQNYNVWKDIGI
jgi:hypothetical protein